MCGWCKDKYGLSWQIVPGDMEEMMSSGDKDAIVRVTAAFLQMKKFDIATLRTAFEAK
jgi:predicted 3-demethylubiquinone-9 3-methyltransferase (glyoxalase superfamily)